MSVSGDSLSMSGVKKCDKFRKLLAGKEIVLANTGLSFDAAFKLI